MQVTQEAFKEIMMNRKYIIALLVLGLVFAGVVTSQADSTRTTPHKFIAYTSSTAVAQSRTIFRITGVASAAAGSFGIYNIGTLGGAALTALAVEGGEATQYDPLTPYDFGKDGLVLDAGSTIVIDGLTVVLEYL